MSSEASSKYDREFIYRETAWDLYPDVDADDPWAKAPPIDYGQDKIAPQPYYSETAKNQEWDKLWTKTWLIAGVAADIPNAGDYFTYQHGKESFIISRTGNGKIEAMYNVCAHRGSRVVLGDFGHVKSFTCPFHSWEYSLDGDLLKITDEEEFPEEAICPRGSLKKVRCETWGGFVFINMDDEAEELQEYLGVTPSYLDPYHLDQWTVLSEVQIEVKANWKTGVDAFIEGYHVHAVHPELADHWEDRQVQYDCYSKGHSRMIVPFGLRSSRLTDELTELNEPLTELLKQFGVDAKDYEGPLDNVRKILPEIKRKWAEENGIDFFDLSDQHLINNPSYHIFPNATINAQGDNALLQRWIPHAEDPEKLIYSIIALLPPMKNPGETKLINMADQGGDSWQVDVDETQARTRIRAERGEDVGYVLHQDVIQMELSQMGIRSDSFNGMVLGPQEIRIRHYLAELDKYLTASD